MLLYVLLNSKGERYVLFFAQSTSFNNIQVQCFACVFMFLCFTVFLVVLVRLLAFCISCLNLSCFFFFVIDFFFKMFWFWSYYCYFVFIFFRWGKTKLIFTKMIFFGHNQSAHNTESPFVFWFKRARAICFVIFLQW